jgi:hypothetical protein
MQSPYSQLEAAARRQDWHNPTMKNLLTACIALLAGAALLQAIRGDPLPPIGWPPDNHAGVEFTRQYMGPMVMQTLQIGPDNGEQTLNLSVAIALARR